MSEKASKGRFLKPDKLQNHGNERKAKVRRKRKSEEKERYPGYQRFFLACDEVIPAPAGRRHERVTF